jgi:PPIC-type PPIASE domain
MALKTPTFLLVAVGSVASLGSCGDRRNPEPPGGSQAKVLATVNGAPITELDLEQRSKGALGGAGPGHDAPPSLLQTLVRDELIYQKAVQLGLDREPGYRIKVDQLRAQVRAIERQEIAGLYRRWVHDQATVSEAEARDYFDKNAALIRTRFHVLQILYKGRFTEIAKDHEDVKGGTPFEEVAARRFPVLPAGSRPPWDLGELTWVQLPQAWRGIVDRMEPGQVSDVIQGPNDRFWIVKLAGKTLDPGVAFEGEKDRIVEQLREQRVSQLYDRMLAEMKEKAKVVYPK